jgi:hypothetical protein
MPYGPRLPGASAAKRKMLSEVGHPFTPIGQHRCLNGIVAGDKFAQSVSLTRQTGNALMCPQRLLCAQRRGMYNCASSTARRSKPPRNGQAVEGNLGGFCVYNSVIEVSRDPSWPSADALTRVACCGQLRSASRVAQPSSSAERAVFVAMWS